MTDWAPGPGLTRVNVTSESALGLPVTMPLKAKAGAGPQRTVTGRAGQPAGRARQVAAQVRSHESMCNECRRICKANRPNIVHNVEQYMP